MAPSLVILAAGLGSRFGGLKQMEPVGPGGETLLDYSVYDAIRAGFSRIVFVIRPDMADLFPAAVGRRFEQRLEVAYAYQRLDALPDGCPPPPDRTKPWGTAHAVLAAADAVPGPFAVVNADDFYGASSFAAIGRFLADSPPAGIPTYAMVGYRLLGTLPDSGAVSRAVCRCTPDGRLTDIVEVTRIERHGPAARHPDADGRFQDLRGDELVSMNLWGFFPSFFDELRRQFTQFIRAEGKSLTAELHLPVAVKVMIAEQRAHVRVLPGNSPWCGITNPADRLRASDFIRGLIAQGEYPEKLWP